MTPAAPEANAMAEALRNHGKDRPNPDASRAVDQLRHEVENMQVVDGQVAWPYVKTPAGGGDNGNAPQTRFVNVFVDGTLQVLEVYVKGSSTFGPF